MSLSSAINTAQSMLANTSKQTSVISKNISNANNPDYSQRSAVLSVGLDGGSQVVSINRAQNAALLKQLLAGNASSGGQSAVLDGLNTLSDALGTNDYQYAPSTLIASLQNALQTYSAKPNDITTGQSAVGAANDLANGLNALSNTVQQVRSDADAKIATDVQDLNSLLSQFQTTNTAIIRGTQAGKDVSDELDQRDKLLKSISNYVGVDTVTRTNNDMVIYTSDGTTLFESVPRQVTFTPTLNYAAGTTGAQVRIDGVPLKAGQGGNTSANGELEGLLQLRDSIAPQFQNQLDQIAGGLIQSFAETDQSAVPTQPDMPGLFTSISGTVPASGTVVTGLAASISVNAAVDPEQGGDPSLLRDGGINGAAYIANTSGGTGYSDLLDKLTTGLGASITFNPSAGLDTNTSLTNFSSSSLGWLQQLRSDASTASETKSALASRSQDALSNATGVSIDQEMSKMLDLEQSYRASAKMISTVGEMLDALMQAV